jgi:hypothetical protein
MDKEIKTKLISRIGLMKSKADLKSLMENASNIHGDLQADTEIQKAVKDRMMVLVAADAAAKAVKAKPAPKVAAKGPASTI